MVDRKITQSMIDDPTIVPEVEYRRLALTFMKESMELMKKQRSLLVEVRLYEWLKLAVLAVAVYYIIR